MTTATQYASPRTAAILQSITNAVEVFAPFFDLPPHEYECVQSHITSAIHAIRTGTTYKLTTNDPGMLEFRELLAEFYPANHAVWNAVWTPEQDREWIAEYDDSPDYAIFAPAHA